MKNLFLFFFIIVATWACQSDKESYQTFKGQAQGTTYQITYFDSANRNFQPEIDSILHHVDGALSNYITKSNLKDINQIQHKVTTLDTFGYVSKVFLSALTIYKRTEGAFNPAIYPLVKAYGFGPDGPASVAVNIDSLLNLTDLDSVSVELQKNEAGQLMFEVTKQPYQQFDFNAIAQGMAVDLLFEFIQAQGVQDLFVELGGELRVGGVNPSGKPWQVGIDKPEEHANERPLKAILSITNAAVATSGNYRKYAQYQGQKVVHTINPKSGMPVRHNLLSATVVTSKAMEADAYATAFMVMGYEQTRSFLTDHPNLNLEVYLIYSQKDGMKTYISEGLKKLVRELS